MIVACIHFSRNTLLRRIPFPLLLAVCITVGEPRQVFAGFTPGNLFVTDAGSGSIFEFTPNGTETTIATGLTQLRGIAFDNSGDLLAATTTFNFGGHGVILRINPAGQQTVFATIPGNHLLEGIAVHGSDVFVTTALTNPTNAPTIFKISPDGAATPFGSFPGNGFGIAFNAAGDLFAADSTVRKIFEFAPNGHRTTFASRIGSATPGLESGPVDVAFDNNGNLFTSVGNVASAALGEIVEILPSGTKSLFVSGLGSPSGLAFDSNGNLFVSDLYAGKVFEFSPAGMETVFASGFLSPGFLAFGPPTGHGVPDSGTTAMLLGSALAVMALLHRVRLV